MNEMQFINICICSCIVLFVMFCIVKALENMMGDNNE